MTNKPVHTVILDSGPIIRAEPSISSLLQQCEQIVSSPLVIAEIKDEAARTRLQTQLLPFLQLQNPKPESIKAVSEFARKTGDLSVLSKTDLAVLALAYELECERNGGNWRLRMAPGQKRVNGPPPAKLTEGESRKASNGGDAEATSIQVDGAEGRDRQQDKGIIDPAVAVAEDIGVPTQQSTDQAAGTGEDEPIVIAHTDRTIETIPPNDSEESTVMEAQTSETNTPISDLATALESTTLLSDKHSLNGPQGKPDADQPSAEDEEAEEEEEEDSNEDGAASDDSEGGWITASNLRKHQQADQEASSTKAKNPSDSTHQPEKTLQVATITSDFAMQNVLLQMNLNLLSTHLSRVKHVKSYVLRCHACFLVVRDTTKQFCPRCGKPTLTRVTCSTDSITGKFNIHLSTKHTYNKRGDRFSIPKPATTSSSGKVIAGGGQHGWGANLMFSEDQKEFSRQVTQKRREENRARDLMDEDFLPGILSGDRGANGSGGRIRIGAGRNVNARRRKQ